MDLLGQGSNAGCRDSSVDRLSYFDKAPQDGRPLWNDSQVDSTSLHSYNEVKVSRAIDSAFRSENLGDLP